MTRDNVIFRTIIFYSFDLIWMPESVLLIRRVALLGSFINEYKIEIIFLNLLFWPDINEKIFHQLRDEVY